MHRKSSTRVAHPSSTRTADQEAARTVCTFVQTVDRNTADRLFTGRLDLSVPGLPYVLLADIEIQRVPLLGLVSVSATAGTKARRSCMGCVLLPQMVWPVKQTGTEVPQGCGEWLIGNGGVMRGQLGESRAHH